MYRYKKIHITLIAIWQTLRLWKILVLITMVKDGLKRHRSEQVHYYL